MAITRDLPRVFSWGCARIDEELSDLPRNFIYLVVTSIILCHSLVSHVVHRRDEIGSKKLYRHPLF